MRNAIYVLHFHVGVSLHLRSSVKGRLCSERPTALLRLEALVSVDGTLDLCSVGVRKVVGFEGSAGSGC